MTIESPSENKSEDKSENISATRVVLATKMALQFKGK
jgi:hypothetical protein